MHVSTGEHDAVQANERHPRYSGMSFIICTSFSHFAANKEALNAPKLQVFILASVLQTRSTAPFLTRLSGKSGAVDHSSPIV